MADAADTIAASDRQSVLTVADLNTSLNHEPRVEDIRLAEALGFERPRIIRDLIERHREALERLGEVCRTVRQTSAKGGRPGRTFWLNKRQALYLCTKSETPRATETTIAMVEVFDAHLAGRLAQPGLSPPAVPFLPGAPHLVSSLDVARALARRHTGILRLLDVLAAERPELLGAHVCFSTYLHENGRPYRCFHLDRDGFAALMHVLAGTNPRAAALRDATLAAFAASPALPPPPAPAPDETADPLNRDGLALMRIAGEIVIIDTERTELGRSDLAVRIHDDGRIDLGFVQMPRDADPRFVRRVLGAPRPPTNAPDERGAQEVQDEVRLFGAVVTSLRVARPRSAAAGQATRPTSRMQRSAGVSRAKLPDLATAVIAGAA